MLGRLTDEAPVACDCGVAAVASPVTVSAFAPSSRVVQSLPVTATTTISLPYLAFDRPASVALL